MSIETREWVANNVDFNPGVLASDLTNTAKTSTYLIGMLQELIPAAGHKLLLTSINTDHSPGTNHERGKATDLWHADWATVGDEKITDVMKALTQNEFVTVVGLGGVAKQYRSYVTWPSRITVFDDDDEDHLHCCVATDGSW